MLIQVDKLGKLLIERKKEGERGCKHEGGMKVF